MTSLLYFLLRRLLEPSTHVALALALITAFGLDDLVIANQLVEIIVYILSALAALVPEPDPATPEGVTMINARMKLSRDDTFDGTDPHEDA